MRWLLTLSFLFSTTLYGRSADRAYEIMQQTKQSILRVEYRSAQGKVQGHGTAFVVKHNGKTFTLTAAHVCADQEVLYAVQGKTTWKLKVLDVANFSDLCILQNPKGIQPLELANKVRHDEYVYLVGFPGFNFMTSMFGRVKEVTKIDMPADWIPAGECKGGTLHTHTEKFRGFLGAIGVLQCFIKATTYITTVPTSPGSSGGPMLNDSGEVIGVMSVYNPDVMNWAQAVVISEIKRYLNNK